MSRRTRGSSKELQHLAGLVDFGNLPLLPRTSRLPRATLLVSLLLAIGACSAQAGPLGDLGSGGTGGAGGATADGPARIDFDDESPLMTLPGEARTIRVTASPPGVHVLRFSLHGTALDAALDRSEVETNADGSAELVLTTPTKPTTFSVRASAASGVSAQRAVSVSASGFGTVQILPSYGGKRPISYWVGSVLTGTSCADVVGIPPPDGSLTSTALSDGGPRIESVPAGPLLAVTVRAGHYVGGCKDVPAITPDAITSVTVSVADRPLQLDETRLRLQLGVEARGPTWETAVGGALSAMFSAARDGAEDDAAALLDAMWALAPSADAGTFGTARALAGWDSMLLDRLGSRSALEQVATPWIVEGLDAFVGATVIDGTLTSAGKVGGQALLELESVGGLDPDLAGFAGSNAHLSWAGEPGDAVLLGGELFWLPSELLAQVAESPARASGALSVTDALGERLGCDDIGATLAATAPAAASPSCDAACYATLCTGAIAKLWDRARTASAANAEIGSLDLAVAGVATVDDEARPTGFDGSWVGTLDFGAAKVSVSGSATAEAPLPK